MMDWHDQTPLALGQGALELEIGRGKSQRGPRLPSELEYEQASFCKNTKSFNLDIVISKENMCNFKANHQ